MHSVELGTVASVLHSSTVGEHPDPTTRVLGAPIGMRLPSIESLPPASELNVQVVPLSPRDLVGDVQSGEWALLPDDYEGASADGSLIVLRVRAGSGVAPEYLLAHLRLHRDVPARTTIGSETLEQIRAIAISPPSLSPVEVARLLGEAQSGLDHLEGLKSEVLRLEREMVSAPSQEAAVDLLRQASDVGRIATEIVRRNRDPLHEVMSLYPYPVARPVRRYVGALESVDRYKALLRAAECLVITLAQLGLGWSRSKSSVVPASVAWHAGLITRGLAFGHWLEVVKAVANDTRGEDGLMGRYSETLRNRRTGLLNSLDQLIIARNEDAHGRGPQNEPELQDALATLEDHFRTALMRSAFLLAGAWILPERTTYRKATGGFDVVAWRAMGDHPDFERIEFIWETPLAVRNLYVLEISSGRAVDLDPFAIMGDCPRCRAREMYYPDRVLSSGSARVISFDRGHQSSNERVGAELVALAWSLPTAPEAASDSSGSSTSS